MKYIRTLSLVLSILLVLTLFVGFKKTKIEDSTFYDGLKAEKVGTIDVDWISSSNSNGFVYEAEDGKYGIMTLDGKRDTGAIYTMCRAYDNYFLATTAEIQDDANIDDLNCYGVVDVNGKELVPMEYAAIKELNERYIRVCEATEQTDNEDEALVYSSDDWLSVFPDEDDTFYKGNWYVYDAVEGKCLDGITGTKGYYVHAYGNILIYTTDDGEDVYINEKCETIPARAHMLQDGYYDLEQDDTGTVYNSDGEPLFRFDPDGYTPYRYSDGYILADKWADGDFTYAFMDLDGNIVSAEFAEIPVMCGDLIYSGDKLYDFNGKEAISGTYEDVYYDEVFEKAMLLKNDDDYTLIQKDGTILWSDGGENIGVGTYNFAIQQKDDEMYYCFADEDYSLDGYGFSFWLIQSRNENRLYDVIDSITGETLLQGYRDYDKAQAGDQTLYVYARKADGGMDIYTVS